MKDRDFEMLNWDIENDCRSNGYEIICGVDEAGRGPLAGPVYAAACVLPFGFEIPKLNDSKKLSPKTRDLLFDEIVSCAVAYAIDYATVDEIDEINILNASMLSMSRAVDKLKVKPDLALVDGNIVRKFNVNAVPIVKGDACSPSIAAASILAKVSRDRYCLELDRLYPEYGFAKHKGYPTHEHIDKLRTYGLSPCHRKTFICKSLTQDKPEE